MRAFLILLILANLGYFAWQQGWVSAGPEPGGAPGQQPFRQAEQELVLVSELPQGRRDLMRTLSEARTSRASSQQQIQQIQQEIATVETEIGEVQEQFRQDQARSAEAQQALLDSLDAAVAVTENAEPAPDPMPWCASAGVFADQPAALAFVEALAALGIKATIDNREEPVSSTWWVYMPAFDSEAQATDMLAELQAKNIDSYYMRSGEMAGGISLGVFSRQESALIEQQRKADQGYATSIREVFRMGDRLYVELVMPDAALREAPEWTAFLASAGGVEVVENACEMIASEIEFP